MEKEFWENRYESQQTGWDLGQPSPPLMELMKTTHQKDAKILIPGCGSAHEAKALMNMGFNQVWLIDISEHAVEQIRKKLTEFPQKHLICEDFFHWKEGDFDIILEQTFFCAIPPVMRENYAKTMHQKLKPGGILQGVLFNREFEGGPPFGGHEADYKKIFEPYFHFILWESCPCSIPPRANSELWFQLKRKD